MKRKWLSSDEMRHATHGPGECWENIAKFGNTPRWVVTTWAAIQAKADAEDPPLKSPPKRPRSVPKNTPEVTPEVSDTANEREKGFIYVNSFTGDGS